MQPNKSLGQHWLYDEATLNSIADQAKIIPGDTVLEIGPGLGTLTEVLLTSTKNLIAVEFDEALAEQLEQKFDKTSLKIVNQDILKFNFSELPEGYKIVANIPYYLTSKLIRLICETNSKFSRAVLLVQKEVAERVCAKPGQTSLLSISTQFYCRVSLGQVVPASLFTPPPKVDSRVLILDRRSEALFDVNEKQFFRLVKAGFSERRKKLRSSLSGGLSISKSAATTLLESAGINPDLRAQNLSLEQWRELYRKFY